MARIKNTRKARFLSALARVGMTMEQWAGKNGLTREHLSRCVNGHYDSPRVLGMVDAFIADVEAKVLAA